LQCACAMYVLGHQHHYGSIQDKGANNICTEWGTYELPRISPIYRRVNNGAY